MISATRAAQIVNEDDAEKRDALIDALSKEDAKYMLKALLHSWKQDGAPGWSQKK